MLEKEIRIRIYQKLKAIEEGLTYDITTLNEYLAIIRKVLMLYRWDNKEELQDF